MERVLKTWLLGSEGKSTGREKGAWGRGETCCLSVLALETMKNNSLGESFVKGHKFCLGSRKREMAGPPVED